MCWAKQEEDQGDLEEIGVRRAYNTSYSHIRIFSRSVDVVPYFSCFGELCYKWTTEHQGSSWLQCSSFVDVGTTVCWAKNGLSVMIADHWLHMVLRMYANIPMDNRKAQQQ